jgi:hypothetical protein
MFSWNVLWSTVLTLTSTPAAFPALASIVA